MKGNSILTLWIALMALSVACLSLPTKNALADTAYSITVMPSRGTITVGDCLYFTGTVTQNGRPVNGLSIGVTDPMKQQSIGSAARTDYNGKFIYTVESMCPAKYNDMAGLFEFTFFAGYTSVKSRVMVNTKNPTGLDSMIVSNKGTATYRINLVVNGQNRGTSTIAPGNVIAIYNTNQLTNSAIAATIMDNSGRTLWKTTVTDTHGFSPQSSAFLNPYYNNYWLSSTVSIDGTSRSRIINGIGQVYTDYANKQVYLGNVALTKSLQVTHGVFTTTPVGITGPGCETFVGLRASCSYSCSASVGIEVCIGTNPVDPIEPFYSASCGISCCVEVATVSCQLFQVQTGMSATYR